MIEEDDNDETQILKLALYFSSVFSFFILFYGLINCHVNLILYE